MSWDTELDEMKHRAKLAEAMGGRSAQFRLSPLNKDENQQNISNNPYPFNEQEVL